MTQPKDGYDAAVKYFTDKPERITDAWISERCKFSYLFRFLQQPGIELGSCGCPTLVHDGDGTAHGPNAKKINALCKKLDLPCGLFIRPKHLKNFARVQRFADEKIPGRTVPKLVDGKWKLVKP